MRRPSTLLRLTRAIVGLVTVWCLGCSSYESILTSLFGAERGALMTCGGESSATSPRAAPTIAGSAAAHARSVGTVSAVNESGGFDCGCGGSCHAPSPGSPTVSAPKAAIPIAVEFAPTAPESVTRAPLLPPPEFAV